MKTILLTLLLLSPAVALAEDAKAPAPAAPSSAAAPANAAKPVDPQTVDISDLEDDYWRPNKDELEVVQNRRFEKAGRFELSAQYGLFQGEDFTSSQSYGLSLAYNLSNRWFIEGSHNWISASDSSFLQSIQQRYNFRPDFNTQKSQSAVQIGWVPIYAKFSLLGEKISHFELYVSAGPGITETAANHLSGFFTVGNKFFLTEHLIFSVKWQMTKYKDQINTPQGTTSLSNGGPGYVQEQDTKNDIIFGIGWMF